MVDKTFLFTLDNIGIDQIDLPDSEKIRHARAICKQLDEGADPSSAHQYMQNLGYYRSTAWGFGNAAVGSYCGVYLSEVGTTF